MTPTPRILVVMGVSGSGKTTIGVDLAHKLGWPFLEGDDLHPPANVAKMHGGTPLTDADRWPWLDAIKGWIDARLAEGGSEGGHGVVACSALRRAYRERLGVGQHDVAVVFLHADRALLVDRLARRKGHFMPAELLDSQITTLEPPTAEERPITVEIGGTADAVVTDILRHLNAD